MRKTLPVTGANLSDFSWALNRAYEKLDGLEIYKTEKVAPLEALIYYEAPDAEQPEPDEPGADYSVRLTDGGKYITVSILVGDYAGRYCCECSNYEWGVSCPYRSGRVKPMDSACPMFDVIISRG